MRYVLMCLIPEGTANNVFVSHHNRPPGEVNQSFDPTDIKSIMDFADDRMLDFIKFKDKGTHHHARHFIVTQEEFDKHWRHLVSNE